MRNRVVWVDIAVRGLDRAIALYSGVPGLAIPRGGGPGSSSCCGRTAAASRPAAWWGAATRTSRRCTARCPSGRHRPLAGRRGSGHALGGEVLTRPHAIAPHGRRAIVRGSEGKRVALHAPSA